MECTLPIAVSACNKLSLLADLERISLVDCIDETDQCISIMAESSTDAIRDLSDFLGKSLNRQILNYSLAYLTKPGDNYGSIIQALTVQTSDGNTSDSFDTVHLVVKRAVTNEYLVAIFQPHLTFVKEIRFYTHIVPAIQHFEAICNVCEQERIDAFIQCVGSRLSLKLDATLADADALLLLENVKVLGFSNGERQMGFDANATDKILQVLAKFHALCIAMRRLDANRFETQVRPYLAPVNLSANAKKSDILDTVCRDLDYIEDLDAILKAKLIEQLKYCDAYGRRTDMAADTPYTTIVHRDLWTNNIMLLKGADGEIKQVKIYDFQLYYHESFAHDLMFFLFTSVQSDVLSQHFESFIERYYEHFIQTLKSVQCPLPDYTYEKIWQEIKLKTRLELLHAFFLVKVSFINSNNAVNVDEVDRNTFFGPTTPPPEQLKRWQVILTKCTDYDLL